MKPRSAKARNHTGKYLRPLVRYRQTRDPLEYIYQRIGQDDDCACWIWNGPIDRDGYGQVQAARCAKDFWVTRAHQLMWVANGGLIQKDQCVLHKCDNPRCVNPKHLFLGTRQDNNLDKQKKGRCRNGATGKLETA